jgi:hypothetical protein
MNMSFEMMKTINELPITFNLTQSIGRMIKNSSQRIYSFDKMFTFRPNKDPEQSL